MNRPYNGYPFPETNGQSPYPGNQQYGMGHPPIGQDPFQPYFQQLPPSNNRKWWAIGSTAIVLLLVIAGVSAALIIKKHSSDNESTTAQSTTQAVDTRTPTPVTTTVTIDAPEQVASSYISGIFNNDFRRTEEQKGMICPNSPEMRSAESDEVTTSSPSSGSSTSGEMYVESKRYDVTGSHIATSSQDSAEVQLTFTATVYGTINGTSASGTSPETGLTVLLRRNDSEWCVYQTR